MCSFSIIFKGNLILSESNQTLLKAHKEATIEKNLENTNPEDINVLNLQIDGELDEGILNREKLHEALNSEEKLSNNQILDKIIQKSQTRNNCSINFITNSDVDLLLTRSIKLDVQPTLDKYVKKTFNKKKEQIVLPKQREINLNDPELKTKGIKKDNINNIYED